MRAWPRFSVCKLQAWLCCLCLLLCAPCGAAPPTAVIYPVYFSGGPIAYDWIVLRAVLEKTVPQFGPFTLTSAPDAMSAQRLTKELGLPNGHINIIARASDPELEAQFQAVRIPIDRGLMGMRLLLVRKADLDRFARVRTLEDLRRLSVGQGKGWIDARILLNAGFSVVESARFESLFTMLDGGRFDAFPRALDEALRETDERRTTMPEIVLEPTLMLHYSLPRYFFVRRDAEGGRLARRVLAGMEMMVRDGSLQALFRKHKGPLVERAALARRRIIAIPNTLLAPETPLQRNELWFNPAGKP